MQFERGVMFPLASEVQIKKRRKQGSAKCCRVDFCACRKKRVEKTTRRKRHFGCHAADAASQAKGVLRAKQ